MPESQPVWKSDNQGVKEETFTQTSRRGGDGSRSGEKARQGGGWRSWAGEVVARRLEYPTSV